MKKIFVCCVGLTVAVAAAAQTAKNAMKAVVVNDYGGPEVLKYEDAPRPEPKDDEILVRVMAAGVNPVDVYVRQGMFAKRGLDNRPAHGPGRVHGGREVSAAGGRLIPGPGVRADQAQVRRAALGDERLHGILDLSPPHEAVHGYRRGRSLLTYATPHTGRAFVLHLDLCDFFPSVRAARVHALFRTAGYPEEVTRVLVDAFQQQSPLLERLHHQRGEE